MVDDAVILPPEEPDGSEDGILIFNHSDVPMPQSVSDAPEKVKAMLILKACGFPQSHIAGIMRISPPAVCAAIKKADPEGVVKYDPAIARELAIIAMTRKRLEALGHLTTAKLKDADARDLAQVIHVMSSHLEKLVATTKEGEKDSTALMKMLQARMAKREPAQEEEGEDGK